MGLGGHLTWAAFAREAKIHFKKPELKIVPHLGDISRPVKSEIFFNNPNFYNDESAVQIFPIQLNKPETNYCKLDTPKKAHHKGDKHIITQICEHYGINNPELKCDLYFSDEEQKKVATLRKQLDEDFIILEPHSKTNYTPNRVYPFEKWQSVVDEVSKNIQVVQVGQSSARLLKNVVDFTGKTSFKEAAFLIGKSKLFVSTEGGLVHAATAVDTTSVVIITGYQDMRMVAYPQNININVANHGPCGLKIPCLACQADAEKHDYNIITKHIIKYLNE